MNNTHEIPICPCHTCRNDSTICGLYGTPECPAVKLAQDLKNAEEVPE